MATAILNCGTMMTIRIGCGLFLWSLLLAADRSTAPVVRQVWTGDDVPYKWVVAPDGRSIAFSDGSHEIALFDLATGVRRSLRSGPRSSGTLYGLAWSQNGSEILYSWTTRDGTEIRSISSSGGEPRSIRRGKELVTPLGWSSDHHELFVLVWKDGAWELASVTLRTGELRVLRTLSDPALRPRAVTAVISPNGDNVAFSRVTPAGTRDISMVSTGTGRETSLITHPADDYPLAWTPDGRRLLFSSDRTGTRDAWAVEVKQGAPSGLPVRVRRDLGLVVPHGMTRDGALFYDINLSMTDVYQVELDGASGLVTTAPVPLLEHYTGFNSGPDWSPDGDHFVAQIGEPGSPEGIDLLIRSLSTGQEHILRPAMVRFNRPRYASDGRSVVVHGTAITGASGIVSIDLQSGSVTPLVPRGVTVLMNPAWSKDGRRLFYQQDGDSVWMLDRESGSKTQIYSVPNHAPNFDSAPSRDGTRIAVVNGDTLYISKVGGESRQVVYLKPPDTFTASPGCLAWTADGRWVIFGKRVGERRELWRVPAESGRAEPLGLTAFAKDIYFLRASDDGRRLAFAMGDFLIRGSEIWAMEHFPIP